MPHRKRVSEAQLLKVIGEKNELQQRCTHLHEENVSLRRTCKKVKREKKEHKRAYYLLQKRENKELRKSVVCAPRQACSRPLVRASRDRSSVCVRASCDAEGHLSAQPETVPQDGQGGGQGGGLD